MAAWYSCLCDASKAVNVCYDNSCPNDATRGTYRNQQISYCQALAQYSSGSASGISGGAVTGVPTAPVNVAVTTTSTVGSSGSGGGPVLTIPGSGSGSGAQTVTTKASSAVSDAMIAGVIILLISVVILA
ncbi:hypothetical protein BCR33DRAFT_719188 [Rhizoclosmatium globosum]|uniref:Uncharacterized protein n=1 Tax=Rhizoclosmatium globosum TaxID=329046 RepID=A0A1Y2C0U0_9FUNG|nr:hypothetical protein BCR33DRAFT_719188 [Rhizoclosmatium globosum]|eukprot:ORY40639.1 hypothetical protein BCR33DRAFT_719188 [Rhizoclosmatium globosum]